MIHQLISAGSDLAVFKGSYGSTTVIVKIGDDAQVVTENWALRALHGVAGVPRLRLSGVVTWGSKRLDICVRDYVDGRTLTDVSPIRRDEACAIRMQLNRILRAVHARGVVHRDLKPSNILVQRGAVSLIDFGCACAIGATEGRCGTRGFASRSAWDGRAAAPQDDWESLRLTLAWATHPSANTRTSLCFILSGCVFALREVA